MAASSSGKKPNTKVGQGPGFDDVTLVVAIDFGTYASGYAYQWSHDYLNDRHKIFINTKWPHTGHRMFKTTTVLLLNPDTSLHSFGVKAENDYGKLEMNGHNPREWFLFRFFKMSLYDVQDLSADTLLYTDDGKSLPMILVFSRAIEYMKNAFMSHLDERGIGHLGIETRWVLTVPAIWNDAAKQMMRKAAEMAGIRDEWLCLALEPECAAIACSQSSVVQIAAAFTPGSTVMVVDMGGGTIDITTVQILRNGSMQQVYMSGGGAWGGIKVNKRFISLIKGIVGAPVWKEFAENHALDEFDFKEDFEATKRDIDMSDEESDETEEKLQIRLPSALKDIWESHTGQKVASILQNRQELRKTVSFIGGRLCIGKRCVRTFFDDIIQNVISHILGCVKDPSHNDTGISAVVLVGGMAESTYVQQMIRQSLYMYDFQVLVPENPECSVLRGATMFGYNPGVIVSRIVTRSYGASMCQLYDPEKYSDGNTVVIEGKKYVKDVFSVHVTRGQHVKLNEWLPCIEYVPIGKFQAESKVFIYTSENRNPKYVTDKDCRALGYLDFTFTSEMRSRGNTIDSGSDQVSGSIHILDTNASESSDIPSNTGQGHQSKAAASAGPKGANDKRKGKRAVNDSKEQSVKAIGVVQSPMRQNNVLLPDKDTKSVAVSICFGGTELRVRAVDNASQTTYRTALHII